MTSSVLRLSALCTVLSATASAQAPNDQPGGATLQSGPGSIADDNSTSSVDGPFPGCGSGASDLWYFYLPASTGALTVTTCSGSGGGNGNVAGIGDSVVAAWADGGGAPGTLSACNDDLCTTTSLASTIVISCISGVGLYVAVMGFEGGVGTYVVDFAEGPIGAVNDVPAGAIVQIGPGLILDNNGAGASVVDGPFGGCTPSSQDLWYFYIPTSAGVNLLTATTCPGVGSGNGNAVGVAGNDTVITLFADAGGFPGAELNCADGGCAGGAESTATTAVTSGVGVYVSVSCWLNLAGGGFAVDFTEAQAVPNDECVTALPLLLGPNVGLSNVGSTGGAPAGTCRPAGDPDVWYSYMATASGTVEFSMCPADGGSNGTIGSNAGLTAYHGVCGSLVQMECNDGDWRTAGGCTFTNPRIQVTVTAGQTIYCNVSGFLGSQGTFDLGVNEFPSIPGHTWANAAVITNGQYSIDTTTDGLAHDGNTPSCQPPGDFNGNFCGAWYAWTAPCQGGAAILHTCATSGLFGPEDTTVEVWTGDPMGGGVQVGCNDDDALVNCTGSFFQSYLSFPVTAGVTYYLYLGGWEGGQGPITFDINCVYIHKWQEHAGSTSIQLENIDGPPGALVISAISLDLLHAGLPISQTFPNGWFFGVPMGVGELITQLNWPGGLPFFHNLDAVGYKLNISAPPPTTAGFGVGFANASVWSVGVAFDPVTAFATILQTTKPTLYVIP